MQALDDGCACSSQLTPHADAVHEIMDLFDSAHVELGDSEETWAVYKAAAHACKQCLRGILGTSYMQCVLASFTLYKYATALIYMRIYILISC